MGSEIKESDEEIIKRQKYADKYQNALYLDQSQTTHALLCNKYVILLLFLYSSSLFCFWSFSAVIVPIGGYHKAAFDETSVYAVFAFIGCVYIISFVVNRFLNKAIFASLSLDKRVLICIQCQCVGYFLLTPFGIFDYFVPL